MVLQEIQISAFLRCYSNVKNSMRDIILMVKKVIMHLGLYFGA